MSFPKTRLRRLRGSRKIRRLVGSVHLTSDDLVYPVFVKEKLKRREPIESIPGQYRYSLNDLPDVIEKCDELRIPGILLFGIPDKKYALGNSAFDRKGVVQDAVMKIKAHSDILVLTDVCMCAYTSHGHCGILEKGRIVNDKTLAVLAKTAVSHAEAGADFVAPSAMMDGQVKIIRAALDKGGFDDVGVMSYSAKFASHFYGPFRDAVDAKPVEGPKDRKSYQMDYHDLRQAMREVSLDIEEGADIVMVKPALPYLDVISEARKRFDAPISAYQVSGEYKMLKSLNDLWVLYESLIAIKRAGADFIISYGALEVTGLLNEHWHSRK